MENRIKQGNHTILMSGADVRTSSWETKDRVAGTLKQEKSETRKVS